LVSEINSSPKISSITNQSTGLQSDIMIYVKVRTVLRTPLEPGVRVRKEFINQNKTRVLSPLPTTYICFTISILHYVIYSCLPFTTTSSPHVSLCLLRHCSVIRMKMNCYRQQQPVLPILVGNQVRTCQIYSESTYSNQLEHSCSDEGGKRDY